MERGRGRRWLCAWGLVLLALFVGACARSRRSIESTVSPTVAGDAGADAARSTGEGEGNGAVGTEAGLPPGPSTLDPNDQDDDDVRGGVDCDDHDAHVHPGAPEVCDGKDNDCDGFADVFAVDAVTYYPDEDGDGLGNSAVPVRACQTPAGWVTNQGDCDDGDATVGAGTGGDLCTEAQDAVVYVAKHGNDDNSGASPMQAVRTLGMGITRAQACPKAPCSVLVAAGTYEEAVTIKDGVSLFGGYAQDFTKHDPAANEVVITSADERTVVADHIVTPTRLDGLTIRGAELSGSDGRSSYAVWVRDSSAFTLTLVRVLAGRGADGAPGADGTPQVCDARGGQGGEAFDCGASVGGNGDAGGDPVAGGEGQAGGDSNCPNACPLVGTDGVTAGTSGAAGRDGGDGAGGAAASDVWGAFVEATWVGALANPGQRGFHGTGGGGGGAGGTKRIRACFGCGTILGGRGGDGGRGGCGGGGGGGGGAGGGAFGLVLVDSTLVLADAALVGGIGGRGGMGGAGAAGEAGSQVTGQGHGDAESKKCGAITYDSGAGGVGGLGGRGGAGGGGAGGAGGAAVTVAIVGSSQLTTQGNVTVVPGTGGAGGPGGSVPHEPGSNGPIGGSDAQRAY